MSVQDYLGPPKNIFLMYSNDEKALRWEYGIELAPYEAESAGGVADEGRGIVDTVLSREPAGAPA